MKSKNKLVPILLGLLLVVAIAVLGLSGGALTTLAKLFSLSPLAPPPSPTAMLGPGSSPLGTPVPLPQWMATSIPVATATPTIPPPPSYPTDEPLPQVTPEQPGATPVRPPSLAPLGFPPADQQALYYVADNAGFSELHVVGIDTQGGKQSEFRAAEDAALVGGTNLVGLYPSPDGKYLALEFLGDGYGEVKIVERASGRVWCPLLDAPRGCWGGFSGWTPDNHFLFQPFDVPPESVISLGVIVVDVATGLYYPLDLPVSPDGVYSLAQNVSVSPDGKMIAYTLTDWEAGKWTSEIWTMRVDSTEKQLVHRVNGFISALLWSPIGKRLAYVRSEPSQPNLGELWLVDAARSDARLLAANLVADELHFRPVWSPDGRYLAFVQLDQPITFDGTYVILAWSNMYVVDTITGQITRLSSFKRRQASNPTWSPDGRFVAFVSTGRLGEESLYSEVWVAIADGSQLYAVSRMAKPWNTLAWLPPVSATDAR